MYIYIYTHTFIYFFLCSMCDFSIAFSFEQVKHGPNNET